MSERAWFKCPDCERVSNAAMPLRSWVLCVPCGEVAMEPVDGEQYEARLEEHTRIWRAGQ